jgi:hypothetical protein
MKTVHFLKTTLHHESNPRALHRLVLACQSERVHPCYLPRYRESIRQGLAQRNDLIYKLHKLKINSQFTKLIDPFLADRISRVKVGNYLSHPFQIKAGVPQGSVLSSLLYIYCILLIFLLQVARL